MKLTINVQTTGNRSEGRDISELAAGDVFYGEIDGQSEALFLKLRIGFVRFAQTDSLHTYEDSHGFGGDSKLVRNYRSVKATLNVGE